LKINLSCFDGKISTKTSKLFKRAASRVCKPLKKISREFILYLEFYNHLAKQNLKAT
jgi:hypothetical protein